jgi:peptidoglycan/xylan/chitin deacetylase (PgdA/CDA1 family)
MLSARPRGGFMKNKKRGFWQKRAIRDLIFLYLIVGVAYGMQNIPTWAGPTETASEAEAVMAWSQSVAARQAEDDVKKVAITFDDGPHPVYTEQILDALKERGVKATFFITGENVEKYPEIVKRIHHEGHLIGNHTYSHMELTSYNLDKFIEELTLTSQVIFDITGAETLFVRPPYGLWNINLEAQLNMFPVMWTIDPRDWNRTNVSGIVTDVVNAVKPNDIILLHDEYKSTKEAAIIIVDKLLADGYEFVTVDEIWLN